MIAPTTHISPAPRSAPFQAWLILASAGIIWGATFSLMKIATDSGAHPLGLSLWNALLGAIILIGVNIIRRRPVPLAPRYLKFYAVCSVLGTSVPGAAYFYAAIHLPTGVLAITIAAVPMLTFLAAAVMGIDRWSALRLTGVVLALMVAARGTKEFPLGPDWSTMPIGSGIAAAFGVAAILFLMAASAKKKA